MEENFDPWTGSPAVVELSGPVLEIRTIEKVTPLDNQFGAEFPKTVPDALYDTLFGPPEPTEADLLAIDAGSAKIRPFYTYAVLDAAKVTNLPEMLEASGLGYVSLFKGKAAEELRDVAPYLVRLEEKHVFTRNLFTKGEAEWQMWDSDPAIFIRSQAEPDELRKHLRKFTKVRDAAGKWYYVRFCDPIAATRLLDQVGYWNALLDVGSRQIAIFRQSQTTWITVTAGPHGSSRKEFDIDLERRKEFERKMELNARQVVSSLPIPTEKIGDAELVAQKCMQRMLAYGFQNARHLRIMAAWELTFGGKYEECDPSGELLSICHDDAPALRRFKRFTKRMDAVGFIPRNW